MITVLSDSTRQCSVGVPTAGALMTISSETEHAGVQLNCGFAVAVFTEMVTAPVHGTIVTGSSGDSLHPATINALKAATAPSRAGNNVDRSLMHWSNSETVPWRSMGRTLT